MDEDLRHDLPSPDNLRTTFRPLPFFGNPHVQTVLGNLWKGPPVRLTSRLHIVSLADGDALAAHETTPPGWRAGDPVALLVHGLGGCHRSAMIQRLTNQFTARGLRAVRVDLRGAGAGTHLARRIYNAACADDVRAVAEFFLRQTPTSSLYAVGLSLGGNVVLNLAGDAAMTPLPGLVAVAAISPPVDLVACSAMLATLPFYDHYYARNLRSQVLQHEARFPDLPRTRFPKKLTMLLFDEIYTAPRGGFANALDYYRRASSLAKIPAIQIPTFILFAQDDPFIAVPPLGPFQERANLHVLLVLKGGHLGFLGRDGAGGLRWGEKRVVDWIMAKIAARD
jgi:predicted alpha/beta-fold hydrolase